MRDPAKVREAQRRYVLRCKAADPQGFLQRKREKDKRYRERHRAKCLAAQRIRSRALYWDNPNTAREKAREQRRKNPEATAARNRRWREKHRNEYLAAQRVRRSRAYWANPNAMREASRRWRVAHPEAVRAGEIRRQASCRQRCEACGGRCWRTSRICRGCRDLAFCVLGPCCGVAAAVGILCNFSNLNAAKKEFTCLQSATKSLRQLGRAIRPPSRQPANPAAQRRSRSSNAA